MAKSILCTAEKIKYQKLQYRAVLSSCSLFLRLSIPLSYGMEKLQEIILYTHFTESEKMSLKWNVIPSTKLSTKKV